MKMRRGALTAGVLLLGFAGMAMDISGMWDTTLTLGGYPDPMSSLTLNLGLAEGWELTTVWSLEGSTLVGHEITLEGSLGALGISGGAAFRIPEGATPTQLGPLHFSLEGLELTGGYISLALSLGDFTFKLTLVEGAPPER